MFDSFALPLTLIKYVMTIIIIDKSLQIQVTTKKGNNYFFTLWFLGCELVVWDKNNNKI